MYNVGEEKGAYVFAFSCKNIKELGEVQNDCPSRGERGLGTKQMAVGVRRRLFTVNLFIFFEFRIMQMCTLFKILQLKDHFLFP